MRKCKESLWGFKDIGKSPGAAEVVLSSLCPIAMVALAITLAYLG